MRANNGWHDLRGLGRELLLWLVVLAGHRRGVHLLLVVIVVHVLLELLLLLLLGFLLGAQLARLLAVRSLNVVVQEGNVQLEAAILAWVVV